VTTPLAWVFYAVAFAVTALARQDRRWAQLVVTGFLALTLGIGIFYYPTTFGPEQQTVFGWFENDVYLGLLTASFYLSIQRLRRVTLVPHR
jgi:cell shape-determining protein MreD